MTTDLEKQFFNTFGIEPYDRYITCNDEGDCKLDLPCDCCDKGKDVYCYPEITDHILLNLVLIMNPYGPPIGANLEGFKQHILELSMGKAPDIKQQVQALFKE